MTSFVTEINFDGLVGPTHNFSGLALGNVAAEKHEGEISKPKQAALQGLEKMKKLHDLGHLQAVLPPHERPHLPSLRHLGFKGDDSQILIKAAKHAPKILAACSSASCMWAANAGTVTASADSIDGKVHFTPANLSAQFHRHIEAGITGRILQTIFADSQSFVHHPALPSTPHFGDEGAANHTRLATGEGCGINVFVYGRRAFDTRFPTPKRYPARQTLEASEAIARQHGQQELSPVFVQQNPEAIDTGVFHNDVIAVGSGDLLFCHEQAFLHQQDALSLLESRFQKLCGSTLSSIQVPKRCLSLEDAVSSYLFNSQLLQLPNRQYRIVFPNECLNNQNVRTYLEDELTAHPKIDEILFFDLKQSMNNGGGPACLRFRVPLTEDERKAVSGNVLFDDALYKTLVSWVQRHYRDQLKEEDLADPQLLKESRSALDELSQILGLGSIYEFQQV